MFRGNFANELYCLFQLTKTILLTFDTFGPDNANKCQLRVVSITPYSSYATNYNQGCLQELTSSEGLWGRTSILICDIKEYEKNLWAEPHFQPFSLGLSVSWPRMEKALIISMTAAAHHIYVHNRQKYLDTWDTAVIFTTYSSAAATAAGFRLLYRHCGRRVYLFSETGQ